MNSMKALVIFVCGTFLLFCSYLSCYCNDLPQKPTSYVCLERGISPFPFDPCQNLPYQREIMSWVNAKFTDGFGRSLNSLMAALGWIVNYMAPPTLTVSLAHTLYSAYTKWEVQLKARARVKARVGTAATQEEEKEPMYSNAEFRQDMLE